MKAPPHQWPLLDAAALCRSCAATDIRYVLVGDLAKGQWGWARCGCGAQTEPRKDPTYEDLLSDWDKL